MHTKIDPDEIFLDSSNLPEFDRHHFEGRIEQSLEKLPFWGLGLLFVVIVFVFGWKIFDLQIIAGDDFRLASETNRLRHTILFNERGIILDRVGVVLAENIPNYSSEQYSLRSYTQTDGLAHVLGYVGYPARDKSGYFYQIEFQGKAGVEDFYNDLLAGSYGIKIIETNATGEVQSESSVNLPENGSDVVLSIDSRVTEALFNFIKNLAIEVGFAGGAGVLMDIQNGEILSLTSFPEYDPGVLTAGEDRDTIKSFISDERKPFLNRVVSGLYTPGSIVKPFIALAALNEKIITPEQKILSTGSIAIPHPYLSDEESVFNDWRAHGKVDMKEALAVSSNVYFYEIGGGFEDQRGLGIGRIDQYMGLFGFGKETGIDVGGELVGVIPTPEWKQSVFDDEWRVGDTYNTAIGQYGFQVTPLQAVRAIGAIANNGMLRTPHLIREKETKELSIKKDVRIKIPQEHFIVVKEGLRDSVLYGTASALNVFQVPVAAKTGTAELGTLKKRVNSWVIGFFPYENPRFAFAVVMEGGRRGNLIGAPFVMRELLEWMARETPEYLQI